MSDKVEQALYWPEPMLQEIKEHAARLDKSLSWCVQRAWALARAHVTSLGPADHDDLPARYTGEKCKQTLFFPSEMLLEIKDTAQRLDRSLSWVVGRAWAFAVPDIAKIADVNPVAE